MSKNSTKKVKYRVWKAIDSKSILFGTAIKEKMSEEWLMVKVKWDLPHSEFKIDKWQRRANLSSSEIKDPGWF
tara:strand:- start:99 stop:317 length:219 start_codon:yes stop_codon:yes gene_type:complete